MSGTEKIIYGGIDQKLTNQVELHSYQEDLVRKGLEEMRAGRVLSHEEVVRKFRN